MNDALPDVGPARPAALGLPTTRRIVEAHGGRIGFDSRPGVGSTFWIELPSVQETAVPDEMKEIRT